MTSTWAIVVGVAVALTAVAAVVWARWRWNRWKALCAAGEHDWGIPTFEQRDDRFVCFLYCYRPRCGVEKILSDEPWDLDA